MPEGVLYVVARKKRGYSNLTFRSTLQPPDVVAGEVALRLVVELPDALFVRPQLTARIVVPKESVTPPNVDATVLDNVREAIQAQTGLDVRVSLVEAAE